MSVEPARRPRADRWIALALILAALVVYNANLRVVGTGDSLASRYVPIALWGWGDTSLHPVARLSRDGHADPYWLMLSPAEEFISTYSLVTPLFVAPLYAPAALYLDSVDWNEDSVRGVAKLMEKLAASIVAALSGGLMFVLLRRRVDRASAIFLAVAYAFGTSTWAISSQALWQHGPAQVFVLVGLLFATRSVPLTVGAGIGVLFLSAVILANRLPDAPLAFGFGLYVFASLPTRRAQVGLVVAGLVGVGLLALFNVAQYGSILGGYERLGLRSYTFKRPLLEGLSGMLVSPTRGLLTFSPFLLFLVFRLRRRGLAGAFGRLDLCLFVGVAIQYLVIANTAAWRSRFVYGPRMLADALPILVWLLAPVLPVLGRAGRVVFGSLVVVAIGFQAIGAFHFPGVQRTSYQIWAVDMFPPVAEFQAGPAAFDLPGITREMAEPGPIEVALSADAVIGERRALINAVVGPALSYPVEAPVEVLLEVKSLDPALGLAGFYGSWLVRLPRVEVPTAVQFEIDLTSKAVDVRIDGGSPFREDIAMGKLEGDAGDGEFVAYVAVRRPENPTYQPTFPLFNFGRDADDVDVGYLARVEEPYVLLRTTPVR